MAREELCYAGTGIPEPLADPNDKDVVVGYRCRNSDCGVWMDQIGGVTTGRCKRGYSLSAEIVPPGDATPITCLGANACANQVGLEYPVGLGK